MGSVLRERITVDLRGLGPALKAHARARNLTVSEMARLSVALALETPAGGVDLEPKGERTAVSDTFVKLTIRLRHDVAARMTSRAQACGLSRGAYLTTLINETPAPPLAVATALGTSTEQLAVVSADLNELIRTIGRGALSSSLLIDDRLRPLLDDVRRHVGLASRLMSELRPARTHPGQRSVKRAASQASSQ